MNELANILYSRSQWPRGPRGGSTAARLLGMRVRISQGAWMFVCCECCVLSGRGLCDGLSLVQRSPTDCGVSEYDHESSMMRRAWTAGGGGLLRQGKKIIQDDLTMCLVVMNPTGFEVCSCFKCFYFICRTAG